MYSSVIREGDLVETPTGRKAVVIGWLPGSKDTKGVQGERAYRFVEVEYVDSPGDTVALRPRLLKHISSKYSGQSLDVILSDEAPRTPTRSILTAKKRVQAG
jgi:hypothetical protein